MMPRTALVRPRSFDAAFDKNSVLASVAVRRVLRRSASCCVGCRPPPSGSVEPDSRIFITSGTADTVVT